MKGYVEFTGKTLDEAIKEACSYFGVEREKLEIEIVNDAKTGIFGLVGVKKATLRARRVQLGDIGLSFGDEGKENGKNGKQPGKGRGRGNERKPQGKAPAVETEPAQPGNSLQPRPAADIEPHRENLPMTVAPSPLAAYEPGGEEPAVSGEAGRNDERSQGRPPRGRKEPERKERAPRERGRKPADNREAAEKGGNSEGVSRSRSEHQERAERPDRPERTDRTDRKARDKRNGRDARDGRGTAQRPARPAGGRGTPREAGEGDEFSDDAMPDFEGSLPVVPLESLDQELLSATVLEALKELATPIVGEFEAELEVSGGRVRLRVVSVENQGLLIGRDGQTLASLQYLLCCIASRKLNASVRVQIDAGDYREKQDEKLRELALSLAQKVKSSSRPQSTRPLSAYHRRIIHMTLQDDPEVQTHSKGEGGMKRVVVVPRRKPAGN